MLQYSTLEKAVGETPLGALERWRKTHPEYAHTPLTYAGRLDPMASGTLLLLIGDECKRQRDYHDLDKAYDFSLLFGVGSDTHDILGRLTRAANEAGTDDIATVVSTLLGPIELPYPQYSAKTVAGRPLHEWARTGRIDEIEIPTRRSTIHTLVHTGTRTLERAAVCATALQRIAHIDACARTGSSVRIEFRQHEIVNDWRVLRADASAPQRLAVADFRCIVSSGTYVRSLAPLIAERLGTTGLAWSIHRTKIGRFVPTENTWSVTY